jgi:hypothetical protein
MALLESGVKNGSQRSKATGECLHFAGVVFWKTRWKMNMFIAFVAGAGKVRLNVIRAGCGLGFDKLRPNGGKLCRVSFPQLFPQIVPCSISSTL